MCLEKDLYISKTNSVNSRSRHVRTVAKISICRVNTTSRRAIKLLEISFGSIFLLFSFKSSQWPHS